MYIYIYIFISPHTSFEFNLRKGQRLDKVSEVISERDGKTAFESSFFFFIVFNLEVIRRLPVLPTLIPDFKMRSTLIQTSTGWGRACCWSWRLSEAVKRNATKLTVTVHHRGSTSGQPHGLKPETITDAWNSPVVVPMRERRSGRGIGLTGGSRLTDLRCTFNPIVLADTQGTCGL